jgi:hypothetical protein
LADSWQDIVDVEDWNEYGELKLHVKIVPEPGTPSLSTAPTPSGTPSKPPSKPASKLPQTDECPTAACLPPPESPTQAGGPQPASFALALRQVATAAAQKAKDSAKKAVEARAAAEQSPTTPPPPGDTVKSQPASPKLIGSTPLLRSPASKAYKNEPTAASAGQTRQAEEGRAVAARGEDEDDSDEDEDDSGEDEDDSGEDEDGSAEDEDGSAEDEDGSAEDEDSSAAED